MNHIKEGAIATVDESTVSNSSFFVLDREFGGYAGNLLTSDLGFRMEYLWQKSLLSATHFFIKSIYGEKSFFQLLTFYPSAYI